MSGDYTRFTFKPRSNYSGVLKQQGRVSLDADHNEQAEIDDRRWRTETIDIAGETFVPVETKEAFSITVDKGEDYTLGNFFIGTGRMYVHGLQVECHGKENAKNENAEFDPILGELRTMSPVPHNGQPYIKWPIKVTSFPIPWVRYAAGLSKTQIGDSQLVYLDVWQREVTAIEDQAIREIALGGPDTATRLQTIWQVKVMPLDTGKGIPGCDERIENWEALTKPSGGRLTTYVEASSASLDPCAQTLSGGYRGVENRLYRVEIHTGGKLGHAKLKWSRDNASIVARVDSSNGVMLTLSNLGRDPTLSFKVGDWVEVLDDDLEFAGHVGLMAKINGVNRADRSLELNKAVNLFGNNPRVKRWDQQGDETDDGLILANKGAISLGDGISISLDLVDGEFISGDYWLFAARSADGSVEKLVNMPPRGILHHFCRLAVITWGKTAADTKIKDCRTIWPQGDCCEIKVRPGQDIQAAIDRVPDEGGCICLLRGTHEVYSPLVIGHKKNLTIRGIGAASQVVAKSEDGRLQLDKGLFNVLRSHAIRIHDVSLQTDYWGHSILIDQSSLVDIDKVIFKSLPSLQDRETEDSTVKAALEGVKQLLENEGKKDKINILDIQEEHKKTFQKEAQATRPISPQEQACIKLGYSFRVTITRCKFRGARGVVAVDTNTLLDVYNKASQSEYNSTVNLPFCMSGMESLWDLYLESAWIGNQMYPKLFSSFTDLTSKLERGELQNPNAQKAIFQAWILEQCKKFWDSLLKLDLIPIFLGKVKISDNEFQVSESGIYFNQVATLGGMWIQGNSVSGFANSGIRIHPWFSVGAVDCYAEWARCIFTQWRTFIENADTTSSIRPIPKEGFSLPAEMGKWLAEIIEICSKACGVKTEKTQSSVADTLNNAIQELRESFDQVWLDDLLNQAYVIDRNTLRGSGDGIWVGVNGCKVTNNSVTILPTNTVAIETVILGLLLFNTFTEDDINKMSKLVAGWMIEVDREAIDMCAKVVASKEFLKNLSSAKSFDITLTKLILSYKKILIENFPNSRIKNFLEKFSSCPSTNTEVQSFLKDYLAALTGELRGYGVALLGRNCDCSENKIDALQSSPNNLLDCLGAPDDGRSKLFPQQAIGGIWYFPALISLIRDATSYTNKSINDVATDLSSTFGILWFFLAKIALSKSSRDSLLIIKNAIEGGATHGIRVSWEGHLNESEKQPTSLDISENMVVNCALHGVYIDNKMLSNTDSCLISFHKNTVVRMDTATVDKLLEFELFSDDPDGSKEKV